MKTKCPCCGSQVKADKPIVDLNTNTFNAGEISLHMSGQQIELVAAVVERWPGIASYDMVMQRMWGANEPENALKQIRVLKCQACRLLREHGFDIKAVHGVGLRFEGRVG